MQTNTCGRCATLSTLLVAMLAEARAQTPVLERYYAHEVVEDANGVIAPWHGGQNGPLDTRLRIAVEALKRYPWVGTDRAVMAAPDFVYNSHWSIRDDGTIEIPPTNDWMCGDLGQRAWSIIQGLTGYYRYSGDPMAFVYVPLIADYILDYAQTPADHDWPRFPISTPTRGKAYGKCDPAARTQLDLCAIVGREMVRAYRLTGDERYRAAVEHWADVFAEKCDFDPTTPPWNRYTDPEVVGWSDELTGTTTIICEFLDAVIALGHTGQNRSVVRARDAGRRYVRDRMLPRWIENDTWARQYWDWDNPVICGIVSMCGDYILAHPNVFGSWRTDLRNMLTLIINRNGADPGSMGGMYSGAWAWPESCTCCGTSLSYNQYTAAPTILRYAALAEDDRMHEIGRRMMIMATYDSHENGVVFDGVTGHAVATREWSNLAHPWPLCQIVEALQWTPDLFGPRRESHIMRSTSVVDRVVYAQNEVAYSTFDAPHRTVDVLRLAFAPTAATADGARLLHRPDLTRNGFTATALPGGDWLVHVRHDGARDVVVEGTGDPQRELDDTGLAYDGSWQTLPLEDALGGSVHASAEPHASVRHSFTGNQVRVFGTVDTDGGLADVFLDGERQLTLVDCWNPARRCRQLLYARSGLDDREHDLAIVVRGAGNPLSRGGRIYVDAIQTCDARAEPEFGSGGGPTHAQRMIFGYTERDDYVDTNGKAWRPATEWIIRTGYGTDTVERAWWTERRSMHIGGTDDDELYRYGAHGEDFWVDVTVGPGEYYVVLKFAETPLHEFLERNEDGGRVTHTVDVSINGDRVMDGVHIATAAGGLFRAYDRVFQGIEPRNGAIEIRFTGRGGHEAIIQALEVGPMSQLPPDRPR